MFEIGTSLREARLRRELDFPALEAITKVRSKYLRALEDERFELLPSHTYIKGFLRAYADSLGLDGQLYVDEYNSRYVAALDDDDVPVRQRRPVPAARRRRQERRESNVVLLALTAIALVTALVIAAWKFGGPEPTNVNGLRQHASPSATTATPAGSTAKPAKPVARKIVLVVRAVAGDSWMEVRVAAPNGRLLYGGTLERGQTQRFANTALYVSFGAPENVTLKVNGKAVRAPRGGAFRLSRAGLVPVGPA